MKSRRKKNNHYNNWNNNKKKNQQSEKDRKVAFVPKFHKSKKDIEEQVEAIRKFKTKEVICSKCGQPIRDLSSAIADKETGAPVHFDCVLQQLKNEEKLGPNERMTYIGQGRFAVLYFENIHDTKHFSIKKIIEWEKTEERSEWRNEMSGLYSKVQ